jgi:hypothetical protein
LIETDLFSIFEQQKLPFNTTQRGSKGMIVNKIIKNRHHTSLAVQGGIFFGSNYGNES